MSEQPQDGPNPRPRTVSRLRAVAPPGLQVDSGERKTIGRYEIVKTIGRGAMGIVYKARDPLLDRIVAVKTIVSPQGVGKRVRSAYLERFQREAKAAAKMQHPAIVTIFDVGVDEELGAPFMVLEYLPGESLADRLDRVRMPLGRGIAIAQDLASALAFAHRQRIVHRDVKPANVLHAGENRWKLADFGIARMPDSDLTQVGIFMGTPGYSPPEAIREGRYTPQADVFAWGAVLYEILSGRIPYEGPDTKTTNSFVVKGDAPPPTHYDPSIPGPLSDVVMRALSPGSGNRLRDGADAEAALKEAWERGLKEGLIPPMALVGEEMPHEKVGNAMHGAGTNASAWGGGTTKVERPPQPPARTKEPDPDDSDDLDVGNVTAKREPTRQPPKGPPTRPAGKPKAGKESGGAPYVIETRGKERIGDDDPTRILVREREEPRTERDPSRESSSPPVKAPAKPSSKNDASSSPSRKAAAPAKKVRERDVSSEVVGPPSGAPAWLIALLVLIVLGGGGFAVWWFNFR
ncbi:MAG TPA: serine/threonine-protein kinase [Kofleriaceae bacterium]|nr:serine/threonine-protein kinase [Kofleriaceae bacterium]